ncbi:MAG: LuxR C-terminal-related transcriptional regulator [Akkermansiaceae bacterium]|nr:LuxR C-terminal-related transcriptional regulator [Akkermansiaceae bacterium]
MNEADHMVLILDDDPALVASVESLLTGQGWRVRAFTAAKAFFEAGLPVAPCCLLLDNQLGPGLSGVEVHEEIQRRGWFIPTVSLTGSWNIQMVVKVMRAGADGFITKPFAAKDLLTEVERAMHRARTEFKNGTKVASARARAATLTRREYEIVELVTKGLLNKEIAAELNLAEITVKVHRGHAMEKLNAKSPAELAHLAALAGITH